MSQNSSEESGSQKINEPRNFVRDFLFGRSALYRDGTSIRSSLCMDSHTEAWIGIPHGGIGMGAIMDLTTLLENYPKSKDSLQHVKESQM